MQLVQNILKQKTGGIFSVAPSDTVYDAIAMMAEKEVGALLVVDAGRTAGIISERDYTRKVILKDKSSKQAQVREIMTTEVVSVTPEMHIDECVALMKKHHIRHLPVSENGVITGMLSLRDLFSAIIDEQADTIEHLEHYVRGEVQ
ncbi:MAG: CBS domain-containing protein [Gammaproteobacteria bacterium]|nr:CBS domain-containing protein [Gammaproteobacteria bacterium]MDD9961902.1 CBS domain-containing protein [Gammaproteobacteria bacterium]MDE0272063.1 CBS domain-containing protein [Gammaproteobacteria bacterium]MXW50384.1 CBS domain-containing protein [Gammaproteobacteria bacterium]MXX29755.1 CBS domain-containing protein [Gammaproteobacteria bacterium]